MYIQLQLLLFLLRKTCVCVLGSPHERWSKPTSDRWLSSNVGGQENSKILGGTLDRNLPSGTRKILSSLDHQQQRVAEWLRSQEITAANADDRPATQSLPRQLKRSQTETHSRRQHPTRTFSYIQAQVSTSIDCDLYTIVYYSILARGGSQL